MACNTAGGTHHAHHDFGSGFCIFNDLAVAAKVVQQQKLARQILIIDLDVHQGDGTAAICKNDGTIFTLSVHCEKNFPQRKAKSDIDIEVPKGAGDEQYLQLISETLKHALEVSEPDLVIFDAGVDVYEHDPLGMLNISIEGIRQREAMVIKAVRDTGTALATVIGGGYDRDQMALARRHSIVVEEAHKYLLAS